MKKNIKAFFKKYFTKKNIIIFSVALVIFMLLVLFGPDTTVEYDWLNPENGIGYHTINSNYVKMNCPGDWLNESVYAYTQEHEPTSGPNEYNVHTDTLTLLYAEDYTKGKKHPASLTVTYLSDQTTPIKDQAQAFASTLQSKDDYKFLSEEETTWEDVGRYYYLNKDEKDDSYARCFPSFVWDIAVWKYEYIDKSTNQKCETLFFERADGFYTINMKYSRFGNDKKEEVYTLFERINFQIDLEIDEQIEDAISYTQELQENGDLVVTITYNGDIVIDQLNCRLDTLSPEGAGSVTTYMESYVEPGETIVYTIDAETLSNYDGIEPYIFASWYAHDIEDGSLTSY